MNILLRPALLVIFASLLIQAPAQSRKKYADPSNVDQALRYLDTALPADRRQYYKDAAETDFMLYDAYLVSELRLGEDYRLSNYFAEHFNIDQERDMAKLIAQSFHRYLNGDSIFLSKQISDLKKDCNERKYDQRTWRLRTICVTHFDPEHTKITTITADKLTWDYSPRYFISFAGGMKILGSNDKLGDYFAKRKYYHKNGLGTELYAKAGWYRQYRRHAMEISLERAVAEGGDSSNSISHKSYQFSAGYKYNLGNRRNFTHTYAFAGLATSYNSLILEREIKGKQFVDSLLTGGSQTQFNQWASLIQFGVGLAESCLNGKIQTRLQLGYDIQLVSSYWSLDDKIYPEIPSLKRGGLRFEAIIAVSTEALSSTR